MEAVPTAQVDALRFKTTQLLDAIHSLLAVIERPDGYTPTWPDVLAKYNLILSLSSSLDRSVPQALHRLALHPALPISEAALDNDLSAILRTQQTIAVLDAESDVVAHVQTALGKAPINTVRAEHDARVTRAARAVQMLREQFEWKARVEVAHDDPDPHADLTTYDGLQTATTPDFALELGPGDVSFDGIVTAADPDTDMELDAAGPTDDEEDEDEVEELGDVLEPDGAIFTPDAADVASTPGATEVRLEPERVDDELTVHPVTDADHRRVRNVFTCAVLVPACVSQPTSFLTCLTLYFIGHTKPLY